MYRWTLNGAVIYGTLMLIHWLNTYIPLYTTLSTVAPWQELFTRGAGGALFGAIIGCFAWEVAHGAKVEHQT